MIVFLKENFKSILTFISGLIAGGFLDYFFLKKRERYDRKDCKILNKLNYLLEQKQKIEAKMREFRWRYDEYHKLDKKDHKKLENKLKNCNKKIEKIRKKGIIA